MPLTYKKRAKGYAEAAGLLGLGVEADDATGGDDGLYAGSRGLVEVEQSGQCLSLPSAAPQP